MVKLNWFNFSLIPEIIKMNQSSLIIYDNKLISFVGFSEKIFIFFIKIFRLKNLIWNFFLNKLIVFLINYQELRDFTINDQKRVFPDFFLNFLFFGFFMIYHKGWVIIKLVKFIVLEFKFIFNDLNNEFTSPNVDNKENKGVFIIINNFTNIIWVIFQVKLSSRKILSF